MQERINNGVQLGGIVLTSNGKFQLRRFRGLGDSSSETAYLVNQNLHPSECARYEPTVQARTVSLIAGQWHDFELLHHRGTEGNRMLDLRLSCPGSPSDAPFPVNEHDASRRRLHRSHRSWPTWPGHASSSAVSRAVDLVAGQRYWMQLECDMNGILYDPPSAPPPPPPQPPPLLPPSPPPPVVTAKLLGGHYASCGGTYQLGQQLTTSWYSSVPKLVWHKIECENGDPCSGRVLWWGWDNKWICSASAYGGGYTSGAKDTAEWCEGDWGEGKTTECPNATALGFDWKMPPPPPGASPPPPHPPITFFAQEKLATGYKPTCAVGARVLTPNVPKTASLGVARWRARVMRPPLFGGTCAQVTDKAECCATIDQTGDICVPAINRFSDGTVCAGWEATLKNAPTDASLVAACPPQPDEATRAARPRVPLPKNVACDSITDRAACCSASDGRTLAKYKGAPCIPATIAFQNGAVCEAAPHVHDVEVAQPDLELALFCPRTPSSHPRHHCSNTAAPTLSCRWASHARHCILSTGSPSCSSTRSRAGTTTSRTIQMHSQMTPMRPIWTRTCTFCAPCSP